MLERWCLSDDRQIGQRLIVGFDGTDLDEALKYFIGGLQVGGLILFARNLVSAEQIRNLCRKAQDYAAQCGMPPLFVAIDQEGGVVARLKPPFTQFRGNPSMRDPRDAEDFAAITARELKSVGINMDMAPVLDVLPPDGPSVMRERAFGSDPEWVAQMGGTIIHHLQANGIMAVAKHFPGIGRTVLDSHLDLPDLDIDEDGLQARDLVPFATAANLAVSGMMLSHIRYLGIDPEWPASLSPAVVRGLLRDRVGYEGVVMTDDLDMGAIARHYATPRIVEQCLAADIDILLICHPSEKIEAACRRIKSLYRESEEIRLMGRRSLERILDLKQTYLA